ncbi:Holliday junction DNA helicase subunit RuvA [Lachnospiraceae bacterium]|nr:Holliday junction DNA helicase subunit RuvA [Lachnospiraceae bacterium]
MIGFLRGKVFSLTESMLLLDVNGVGYEVVISAGTADELPPVGEETLIYTYLAVREDGMTLYGFPTRDDLDIFRMLITVSGIGPKGAQMILSVLSPDDLRFAILSGDAKAISQAPGIGKKTAERVILDLKDKISLEATFESAVSGGAKSGRKEASAVQNVRDDAVEALEALGYSATDAYKAVKAVNIEDGMDANDILKAALKQMVR